MRENPSIDNVLLQASPLPFWSRVGVIFTTMLSSSSHKLYSLTALLCSIHTHCPVDVYGSTFMPCVHPIGISHLYNIIIYD